MANYKVHASVGAVAGGTAAAIGAHDQHGADFLLEVLGGILGGGVAALVPDVVEPASHPGHRSLAHSWAAAAAGTVGVAPRILGWQESCRRLAQDHERLAAEGADAWGRFWHGLLAAFFRILAGAVLGLAVGYGSHLLLDVVTPAGLPLIG